MIVTIIKGIRSSTGPGTLQQQNAGRQKKKYIWKLKREILSKIFFLNFALKFQGRSRYGPRTTG